MIDLLKKYFSYTAKKIEDDFINKMILSLKKNKYENFLDCGSYDGFITLKIAHELNVKNIHGLEIDDNCIKITRKKKIKVSKQDLNKKFDLQSESFDMVFSNQTVEHLYNVDNFISEVYRILKPGGTFMMGTCNLASWHNIFSLILGFQPFDYVNIINKKWRIGNPITIHNLNENISSNLHMKPFTIPACVDIFKLYNFKLKEIIAVGYYPFFYPLCNLFSSIDSKHAVFIAFKVTKPV